MSVDPTQGILILLALLAGYSLLALVVWLLACGRSHGAVRRLNAALARRKGPPLPPDLEPTLAALVAEQRLTPQLAARLRRIAPVHHRGKWVAYPSNAYWAHRFDRLK